MRLRLDQGAGCALPLSGFSFEARPVRSLFQNVFSKIGVPLPDAMPYPPDFATISGMIRSVFEISGVRSAA